MRSQLNALLLSLLFLILAILSPMATGGEESESPLFRIETRTRSSLSRILGIENASSVVVSGSGIVLEVIHSSTIMLMALTTTRPIAHSVGLTVDGKPLGERIHYARDTVVILPTEILSFRDDGVIVTGEGRRSVEEYSGDGLLEGVEDPESGAFENSEKVLATHRLTGPWVVEPTVEGRVAYVKVTSRSCSITIGLTPAGAVMSRETVPHFTVVVGRERDRKVEEILYKGVSYLKARQAAFSLKLEFSLPRTAPENTTLRLKFFLFRDVNLKVARTFYRLTPWRTPLPLRSTLLGNSTGPTVIPGRENITFSDALRRLGGMNVARGIAVYSRAPFRFSTKERVLYGYRWSLGVGGRGAGYGPIELNLTTSRVVDTVEESTPLVQQATTDYQSITTLSFLVLILGAVGIYLYGRRAGRGEGPRGGPSHPGYPGAYTSPTPREGLKRRGSGPPRDLPPPR